MSKYLGMPPQTRVFCAHEYTASNAKFAAHVDPDNQAMAERKQEIDQMRSKVSPSMQVSGHVAPEQGSGPKTACTILA